MERKIGIGDSSVPERDKEGDAVNVDFLTRLSRPLE
jgi:hypothetical protein